MTLTISTRQLAAVAPVLAALELLTPPPTAKGRYALAKAAAKILPANALYERQAMALARRCAAEECDIGGGRVEFKIAPAHSEEFARESAALLEEPVTLEGVRAITHAELGTCPITVQQERLLIECGLLVDEEPA